MSYELWQVLAATGIGVLAGHLIPEYIRDIQGARSNRLDSTDAKQKEDQ